MVSRFHPDVTVIQTGYWETQNRQFDGGYATLADPAYSAYIESNLAEAVQIAHSDGGAVILSTSPYFDDGTPSNLVDAYNQIVESVAAEYPYVSIDDLYTVLDPGGTYATIVNGIVARAPDGVHITQAAVENLIEPALNQIIANVAGAVYAGSSLGSPPSPTGATRSASARTRCRPSRRRWRWGRTWSSSTCGARGTGRSWCCTTSRWSGCGAWGPRWATSTWPRWRPSARVTCASRRCVRCSSGVAVPLMVDFTRREVVPGALEAARAAQALGRSLFVTGNVEALRLLRGRVGGGTRRPHLGGGPGAAAWPCWRSWGRSTGTRCSPS